MSSGGIGAAPVTANCTASRPTSARTFAERDLVEERPGLVVLGGGGAGGAALDDGLGRGDRLVELRLRLGVGGQRGLHAGVDLLPHPGHPEHGLGVDLAGVGGDQRRVGAGGDLEPAHAGEVVAGHALGDVGHRQVRHGPEPGGVDADEVEVALRGPHDVAVRQHHALRRAGRARGVDDRGQHVGGDGGGGGVEVDRLVALGDGGAGDAGRRRRCPRGRGAPRRGRAPGAGRAPWRSARRSPCPRRWRRWRRCARPGRRPARRPTSCRSRSAVAPQKIAARSTTWNSGMFRIMRTTRSPRPTPRARRPAAAAATWSASSANVVSTQASPSLARSATRSGWAATVSSQRLAKVCPATLSSITLASVWVAVCTAVPLVALGVSDATNVEARRMARWGRPRVAMGAGGRVTARPGQEHVTSPRRGRSARLRARRWLGRLA